MSTNVPASAAPEKSIRDTHTAFARNPREIHNSNRFGPVVGNKSSATRGKWNTALEWRYQPRNPGEGFVTRVGFNGLTFDSSRSVYFLFSKRLGKVKITDFEARNLMELCIPDGDWKLDQESAAEGMLFTSVIIVGDISHRFWARLPAHRRVLVVHYFTVQVRGLETIQLGLQAAGLDAANPPVGDELPEFLDLPDAEEELAADLKKIEAAGFMTFQKAQAAEAFEGIEFIDSPDPFDPMPSG